MKVAITGSSGYVGGHLAADFKARGHDVLSLSRRPCTAPWVPYALGDDPSLLPWDGIEVLIHAAYDFTACTWPQTVDRNLKPTSALLDAASQAGVRRLILISSMSAFDGCRSVYGQAKLAMEEHALGLGAVVIRPGLVWGDQPGGVMGALEKLVAMLPVVPYLTGPAGLPQYLIHDEDLAAAVAAAATDDSWAGTIASIMHPVPLSLQQILATVATRISRPRIFVPVPWRLLWLGLRSAEAFHIRLPFRSDSLVGLVYANPSPATTSRPQITCRPFA